MGKIKRFFLKQSIKKDFALYILFYILSSLVLSLLCSEFCKYKQRQIGEKYKIEYESNKLFTKKLFYNDKNNDQYIHYYTTDITELFTFFDELIYNILGICSGIVYPISFIICIGITSILFYKRKLQKPLEILNNAADNISDNNLDFEIIYNKQDELGKLCLSFEKMRRILRDNNIEMWRQIEERRRLNVAFAHDLRTPLTVLKGQSEMLIKYAPEMSEEKIIEIVKMMKRHIARLENYVNTMNDLQHLENIEIQKKAVEIGNIVKQMNSIGASVCLTKKFLFKEKPINTIKMELDESIIMRVYENLLANAIQYVHDTITVSAYIQENYFCIIVSDDGKGFSPKDLIDATKPFYKSSQETDNKHFGMGLNICKILCEKHGGNLKLENKNGAFVTATFRS